MPDNLRYARYEAIAATRDLLAWLNLNAKIRHGDEWTLDRCADVFQLTRERARQIEARALRHMRHPSRSSYLAEFIGLDERREQGRVHAPRLSDEWGTEGRFAVNSRISVDAAIGLAIQRSDGHRRFQR